MKVWIVITHQDGQLASFVFQSEEDAQEQASFLRPHATVWVEELVLTWPVIEVNFDDD